MPSILGPFRAIKTSVRAAKMPTANARTFSTTKGSEKSEWATEDLFATSIVAYLAYFAIVRGTPIKEDEKIVYDGGFGNDYNNLRKSY